MLNTDFSRSMPRNSEYDIFPLLSCNGNVYGYVPVINDIVPLGRKVNVKNLFFPLGGYAKESRIVVSYEINMLRQLSESRLKSLTICLTEQCNLRCKYCIFSGKFQERRTHSSRILSEEKGRKMLDFFFRHSINAKNVRLCFWGGEVLTSFDLLKRLVSYAKSLFGEKLKVEFTTNGTMLSPRVCEWLREHNEVSLCITLNGPAKIHDAERCYSDYRPTHDIIEKNIKYLRSVLSDSFNRRILIFANYFNSSERLEMQEYFRVNRNLYSCDIQYHPIELPNNYIDNDVLLADFKEQKLKFNKAMKIIRTSSFSLDDLAEAGIQTHILRSIHFRETGYVENVVFPGICVPLLFKLYADIDGNLYVCENCEGQTVIGNALSGYLDMNAIKLMTDTIENLLNNVLHCAKCPAMRFCSLCFKQFFKNKHLRPLNEIFMECRRMQNVIFNYFSIYVSILECKPNLFSNRDFAIPEEKDSFYKEMIDAVKHRISMESI